MNNVSLRPSAVKPTIKESRRALGRGVESLLLIWNETQFDPWIIVDLTISTTGEKQKTLTTVSHDSDFTRETISCERFYD
ncbi:MAG: hypothetical protein UY89_C0009G0017 [Parcubacteria group bacterium GW2011_GWA1_54_9]|nr:MAG: hypothetical protein UY89_C0009G0017 [Parcubacteria group bacterium GW2011_GWA1_54_9]KKW42144.1 MAG: hypothetical protein UY91_C0006G0016 [Parcubacteria group bacterium GW2011_GWB1_55_9]